MTDAIKENTGIDISGMDEDDLRKVCDSLMFLIHLKWEKES